MKQVIRLWIAAALALIPGAAHAQTFWFEDCGTPVHFEAIVDRLKPDGRPWDTPLSAPMLRSSAPDIIFCTRAVCSDACADAYACEAELLDPLNQVIVVDKDLMHNDPIGLCESLNGKWTCAAEGSSVIRVRVGKGSSCQVEFERRLTVAENSGCQAQAVIWARSDQFRVTDRIVRQKVSRILGEMTVSLGASLRAIIKQVDKDTKPKVVSADLEIAALQLASKREWLPGDWLEFSLILAAASLDEEAQEGLFPFAHRSVLQACKSLYA